MPTWRPCNACGTPDPEARWQRDGHAIVACRACGLVYVGDDLSTIDFDALYDERYYTGGHEAAFADYLGQAAARRRMARRKLFGLRRIKPRGRLLDIGCAAGFFLAEARAHYEVQGVEPSAFAARFAREQLKLPVFTGTLQAAVLPAGHFDLVTLWDVIEHVADPVALLAEVERLLAPQGRVVLTTGDIGSAYAQARLPEWHLLTPPFHLYFYDRRTLAATAARAGLQVEHIAARGVDGDGAWARSKPALLLGWLRGRGDIMQVRLKKGAARPA
jgi:2-polyprenyl-3-methyl-5-hydroxy-6-metoxy-1,4-benzoquinol methylase